MKKIQFLQLHCVGFIIFAIATFTQSPNTFNGSNSNSGAGSLTTQCFAPFIPGSGPGPIIGLPPASTSTRLLQQARAPVQALKNISTNYQQFVTTFKPSELADKGNPKFTYRTLVFNGNIQKMNAHNQNDKRTFNMGLNQFADIEESQFIKIYSRLIIPNNISSKNPITVNSTPIIPSVTPVPATPNTSTVIPGNIPTPPPMNKTNQLRTQPVYSIPEKPTIASSSASSSTSGPQNIAQAAAAGEKNLPNSLGSTSSTTAGSTSSLNQIAPPTAPLLTSTNPLNTTDLNPTAIGGTINYNPTQQTGGSSVSYTTPSQVSIDWSCKASLVINQGLCGSCYIIAPLQSIYITLRIYNQSVLPLAIQELVSCGESGNGLYGCSGGYFYASFEYARANGVGRSMMYPYNSQAINSGIASTCSSTINSTLYKNAKIKIRQAGFITYGDCAAMIQKLKTQALAVSIATQNFQFYANGTYTVSGQTPNHGVTLVGYNPTDGYKIKNSWGTGWGNMGYAYVSQTTGVCDYSMFPVTGYQGTQMGPCC